MSANESTSEDKIFAIALLLAFFGFGYWTRSTDALTQFLQYLGIPLSYTLADGLVEIVTICLLSLVLIGAILSHFDKEDKE